MIHFSRTRWTLAPLATMAILVSACNKGQPPVPSPDKATPPPDAVATVNGTPILRGSFDDYLKSLLRGKPVTDVTSDEKNQVLDQMINMQLIASQATKDALDKDPEVVARLDLLRTQILADAGIQKYIKSLAPTDQELHTEYDALPDKTEYHAEHILVASKEKAEALIKKLKAGAKFEDVAKADSTDASAKTNGGDLGWFSTAKMVKPFGDAVKGLKKGEMTQEPVQTQFGWHIIRLEDVRDTPFEQMKPQLSNAIIQKKVQAYIETLRKNATIDKKNV